MFCCMFVKTTYAKVDQLRYDSFSQKYQGTSGHGKRMFKEPIIRHLYQFSNVPSREWHSWKVDDDGSSILSGLVVKLYN